MASIPYCAHVSRQVHAELNKQKSQELKSSPFSLTPGISQIPEDGHFKHDSSADQAVTPLTVSARRPGVKSSTPGLAASGLTAKSVTTPSLTTSALTTSGGGCMAKGAWFTWDKNYWVPKGAAGMCGVGATPHATTDPEHQQHCASCAEGDDLWETASVSSTSSLDFFDRRRHPSDRMSSVSSETEPSMAARAAAAARAAKDSADTAAVTSRAARQTTEAALPPSPPPPQGDVSLQIGSLSIAVSVSSSTMSTTVAPGAITDQVRHLHASSFVDVPASTDSH